MTNKKNYWKDYSYTDENVYFDKQIQLFKNKQALKLLDNPNLEEKI